MDKIKCVDCEYCIGRESEYTMETLFFCEHPDQGYINSYFNVRRITKRPGKIGAVKYRTDKAPFKTSPAWCPMKKKT